MQSRRSPRFGGFLGMLLLAAVAAAQQAQRDEVVPKILEEIKVRARLMDDLEYLSDVIGPRLTGTERMKRASDWTLQRFKDNGLENAHLEPFTIANGWERVSARGRIIEPAEHTLTLAALGWSPSTNGVLRGHIVFVQAAKVEDLEQYRGKLKGAIVMTSDPRRSAAAAAETPGQPAAAPTGLYDPQRSQQIREFQRKRDEFFTAEGVAGVLVQSNKEHGLLNMSGAGRNYQIAARPSAVISRENYALLHRLLKRGRVEVELDIQNKVRPGPIEVYNTVAEIAGFEKPEEVVLLGAHLDSWDLGTGATDNATGSSVVVEAARALKAIGVRPKRTIRFLLFAGEEQGLVGARDYLKKHKDELDKFSAAMIHDMGTGRVNSIGLSAHYREVMDQVVTPLRTLGLQELSMRSMSGSDHHAFNEAGVPGFFCIQDPVEYFTRTHHSQSDTFDKARKDDLIQGAQVMAVWAWRVAQLPELMPRKPKPAAAATSSGR